MIAALFFLPLLTPPATANHGPPYPYFVGIEKTNPAFNPQTLGNLPLPPNCQLFVIDQWTARIDCVPPTSQTYTCAYVGVYATHDVTSVGSITGTSQCTNGPAVTATAVAPASAASYSWPGDWDFTFSCHAKFDVAATGQVYCWEGDP